MTPVDQLHVKIFADGADLPGMLEMAASRTSRLTTNPTLMRKRHRRLPCVRDAGCRRFGSTVSFEVFSDEFAEMERRARAIAGWGSNVREGAGHEHKARARVRHHSSSFRRRHQSTSRR